MTSVFGPRVRWRRASGLLAGVLSALLLGGCAAPDEAVAPSGVSVSIAQDRIDIARDIMSIEVHNDGDERVRVTSASYADPRFAAAAEWRGDSGIPPGATRDLRVDVPDAACGVEHPASVGSVRVGFSTAEGAVLAEYPVEDRFDFVASVTSAACFAEEVGETSTIELAGVSRRAAREGEVAVVELVVTVHGDDAIRIESVDGTVLLRPESGGVSWPLEATVAPGESVAFELEVVPTRCDAHALAEDKVGTLFDVEVSVIGDRPVTGVLTLAADDEQRGELHDYVSARCEQTS